MDIDKMMSEIFSPGRTPRSDEYKAGCRAALELKINGIGVSQPYKAGSAAADAYYAGIDEGFSKWRELQE